MNYNTVSSILSKKQVHTKMALGDTDLGVEKSNLVQL